MLFFLNGLFLECGFKYMLKLGSRYYAEAASAVSGLF
jgi:hypothetical protein